MTITAISRRHLRANASLPMKTFYSILAATILFGAVTPAAKAAVEVSVDFFHDNLESYGDWREVGDYGYCWQPRDVGRNWRPYSDGHWLYTDAGWTWDSEEPYSWAVYHYGRWTRVNRVGWVWVPGTEWGPAWVSWRRSPRYVGWAPLPPEAEFSRSVGFSARVDADYDIGPTNYSFVEVRNFGAPRLQTVIVEPRENITIINQTTNITRITYVNNVVYNEGPQYDVISRESSQPIRRLRLERRQEFDGDPRSVRAEQLRARVEGDSLRVVAPQFDAKPATAPRKVATRVEKAEVDRGWKNAGPPAAVAKLRTKITSEPATPAELPPQPKKGEIAATPASAETKPNAFPSPASPTNGKPATGNGKNDRRPKSAAPGAPEVVPAPLPKSDTTKPKKSPSVDRPIVPDQTPQIEKAGKAAKPATSKPSYQPVLPQAAETPQPPNATKGRNKGIETPRTPAEAPPQAQAPMLKKENVEPRRKMPPTAVEPPRQKIYPTQEKARPKPEQPAAHSIDRNAPNRPEPPPRAKRPESHQQAAPAVAQPQPPQSAKEKGKGKGKDEKKDGGKPEGAPQ